MCTNSVSRLPRHKSRGRKTSFAERRRVLRTIQKYICNHVEDICRVCSRDSGKPKCDALLGEILTTCEKIRCINANGELWLRPSYRTTGPMMVHKTAYVEYMPLGVLGVIAPWNYPVVLLRAQDAILDETSFTPLLTSLRWLLFSFTTC